MSYQVLARKWRPQQFTEMVGQRHVLKALVNALDNQRLHHAYLFTGTRGVGKTTLARLFAKSLNCEEGVSSTPCGVCGSCVELAENRFVDLIEVDAASRTKVEDTRELLDNVQYAPTRGRYKVYLIDEVHMLSNHSFNALLKTLEEPPPHVKFLLATTDPQKLPVTVLSRCLQFNLKSMTQDMVVEHLRDILQREQIDFEQGALLHLGKAAQGSMRDALSLTDQSVAYGQGVVREAEVAEMLGTVDTRQIVALVSALCAQDAAALLQRVQALAEFSPDWQHMMADVLAVLHQLTILQLAPTYEVPVHGSELAALAAEVAPEDLQLYYQLGLQAHKDLEAAPEARQGFEMALLRMLAFTPDFKRVPKTAPPAPSGPPTDGVVEGALNAPADGNPDAAAATEPRATPANEAAVPADDVPPEADPGAAVASPAPAPDDVTAWAASTEPTEPVPSAPARASDADGVMAAPHEAASPSAAAVDETGSVEPPAADSLPPWDPEPVPEVHDAAAEHLTTEHPATTLHAVDSPTTPNTAASFAADAAVESEPDDSPAELPRAVDMLAALEGQAEPPRNDTPAPSHAPENAPATQFHPDTLRALDAVADDLDSLSDHWLAIIPALELAGVMENLMRHSAVLALADGCLTLAVQPDYQQIYQEAYRHRVAEALQALDFAVDEVIIEFTEPAEETLHQREQRIRRESYKAARSSLEEDAVVRTLISELGGELLADTVEPVPAARP